MKLTHPDSNHTVEVDSKDAERYLLQGWAKVKSPAKKAASKKPETKPE